MAWLADNGYTGITMKQLFEYWDEGFALPKKPVVISFDDGYPSHDEDRAHGTRPANWPGVLFLELNNVGVAGDRPHEQPWSSRLIASGWEIDSHTISHPDLTTARPV